MWTLGEVRLIAVEDGLVVLYARAWQDRCVQGCAVTVQTRAGKNVAHFRCTQSGYDDAQLDIIAGSAFRRRLMLQRLSW